MQIGQSITLDFILKNTMKLIAKQNDINSRYLLATLKNNRQSVIIPENSIATLNITRVDGEKKCYRALISNNIVSAFLSDWAVDLEGIITCDVSIIENNEKLTTMPFKIEIVKACCTSDDIEDATSEEIMTQIINMLETYSQDTEHIAEIDAEIDKLKRKIVFDTIRIEKNDWIFENGKYHYTVLNDDVSSNTYIIANEISDILYYADIQSYNGSYTITASELPTEAVNLLLIFLRGNE